MMGVNAVGQGSKMIISFVLVVVPSGTIYMYWGHFHWTYCFGIVGNIVHLIHVTQP